MQQGPNRRVAHACDACHKRKYKCDGAKPQCASCTKSKIDCVYTPRVKSISDKVDKPTRAKGPRALKSQALRERIRELEMQAQILLGLEIDSSTLDTYVLILPKMLTFS
jgi:hypothetical protein